MKICRPLVLALVLSSFSVNANLFKDIFSVNSNDFKEHLSSDAYSQCVESAEIQRDIFIYWLNGWSKHKLMAMLNKSNEVEEWENRIENLYKEPAPSLTREEIEQASYNLEYETRYECINLKLHQRHNFNNLNRK